MKQQINLYQGHDINAKQPIVFALALFLTLIMVVIALSVYLQNNVALLQQEVMTTQHALIDAETQTQMLKMQFPEKELNTLLSKQFKHSQHVQTSLVDDLDFLSDTSSDRTQGFSRYFTAFSQQSTDNLWLTRVLIDTDTLNIEGGTIKAKNVPVFLQNLHKEPVFKGKVFVQLKMDTNIDSDAYLDFNISTSLSDDDTQ